MKRGTALFAVLTFLTIHSAHANPVAFYKSIANSISSAQGRVILYTRDGLWKDSVKVPGIKVPRSFYLRTSPGQRFVIDFSYQGGAEKSATIDFRPAIHFEVPGPGAGLSLSIKTVSFDDTGAPNIIAAKDDNGHFQSNPSAMAVLNRVLNLDSRPMGMLLGSPFPNLGPATQCSADESNCSGTTGVFITEVRLLPHSDLPALSIVLKDGAQIDLGANNLLKFLGPASLTLQDFDYTVDDKTASGDIDSLQGTLQPPSRVVTNGIDLQFDSSTVFKIQAISFSQSPGNPTVLSATGGSIQASVGNMSSMALSGGSHFFFDTGTSVVLVNPSLVFGANTQPDLSLAANSTIQVKLRDGFFEFGPDNHVEVSSGQFSVELQGIWSSASPQPMVSATLQNVAAQIMSGQFKPTPNSTLLADRGSQFAATELDLGPGNAGLDGKLTLLNIVLAPGSTFGVPNGFTVSLSSGSVQMEGNDPLTFQHALLPTGSVSVNGAFRAFLDKPSPDFALSHGQISLTATRGADGTYSGSIAAIKGTLGVTNTGQSLSFDVAMHDSTYTADPQTGKFETNGQISATLTAGNQISITTPAQFSVQDHAAMAVYALSLDVQWPIATTTPDLPFSISNKGLHINKDNPVKFNTPFRLVVPKGAGEHESRKDANSADGTHGPDDMKHLQEVLQDDFGSPGIGAGCTVHIYLTDQVYDASADLTLQSIPSDHGSSLNLSANNFSLGSDLGFKRDGCDMGIIGTIAGGVLGEITGVGANGLVVGHFAGARADDKIDALIEGLAMARLNEFQVGWTVVIPPL